MGERLPISIVLITSGKNPREPLWISQLLLSGKVSQVLRVSPEEVVFSEKSYPGVNVREVFCPWGDRNQARNLGHEAATEDFVYHLDEDVEPPTVDEMTKALESFRDQDVQWVSGPYLSALRIGIPARIYNLLSSLWVKLGERDHALFLGGHVLCRRGSFLWPKGHQTGGEELTVSRELHHRGHRGVYLEEFAAYHHNSHTWSGLLKRLRQHEAAKKDFESSRLQKLFKFRF